MWAGNEQDALDTLVDHDLGAALLVEDKGLTEDEKEDLSHLGNAGELADLTHAWLRVVELNPARDIQLMLKFAEARGDGGCCNLGEL